VLATSVSGTPNIPKVATLENFAGRVRHSSQFKGGGEWAGKSVVVLGTGTSAHVADRVGRVWGFDDHTQELRNMWTKTGQPGLRFTGGAFSQCRIYSRYIALQIAAIEAGRLPK
jgi:hypothetical protein